MQGHSQHHVRVDAGAIKGLQLDSRGIDSEILILLQNPARHITEIAVGSEIHQAEGESFVEINTVLIEKSHVELTTSVSRKTDHPQ